jgi:hypothetical protein
VEEEDEEVEDEVEEESSIDPELWANAVTTALAFRAFRAGTKASEQQRAQFASALCGLWEASGLDHEGEPVSELLLIEAQPCKRVGTSLLNPHLKPTDAIIAGAVDDGDGQINLEEDEEDCILQNGQVDFESHQVSFEQLYSDGVVTTWDAVYDPESGLLVNGRWSGECRGTFVAKRQDQAQEHVRGTGDSTLVAGADDAEFAFDFVGGEGVPVAAAPVPPMAQAFSKEQATRYGGGHPKKTDEAQPTTLAPNSSPAAELSALSYSQREPSPETDEAAVVEGVPAGAWERVLWWVEREHGIETVRRSQLLPHSEQVVALQKPPQPAGVATEELAALRTRVQELEAAMAAKQLQ